MFLHQQGKEGFEKAYKQCVRYSEAFLKELGYPSPSDAKCRKLYSQDQCFIATQYFRLNTAVQLLLPDERQRRNDRQGTQIGEAQNK